MEIRREEENGGEESKDFNEPTGVAGSYSSSIRPRPR